MNRIRQSIGIDISAESFVASIGVIDDDQMIEILSTKTFLNTETGFKALLKWSNKFLNKDLKTTFAMEATGVYFERLAYFLYERDLSTVVLLPNKVAHYAKTLNLKSKNDVIDAKVIARFAVERKFDTWKPTSPTLRTIKQLLRERNELIKEKTQINNQLHSKKSAFQFSKSSIQRARKRIQFIDNQIKDLMDEIDDLLLHNEELNKQVKLITSIKGVGQLTALIVLAETNAFALIKNRKQLVSYCGFDVVEKQSGSSVNGKTKISKKGNKFIRKALHYPSLSATRTDQNLSVFYQKINERNTSKMVGLVAVQRKLLLLIYAIWKSGKQYDPNYLSVDKETKSSFFFDSTNQKDSRTNLIALH